MRQNRVHLMPPMSNFYARICVKATPSSNNIADIVCFGRFIQRHENAQALCSVTGLFEICRFSQNRQRSYCSLNRINDLFCLAQPTVYPFFTEDVFQWLDEKDIRFSPQVSFSGKSTFSHLYDFLIPKSKQSPERLLKVMNTRAAITPSKSPSVGLTRGRRGQQRPSALCC